MSEAFQTSKGYGHWSLCQNAETVLRIEYEGQVPRKIFVNWDYVETWELGLEDNEMEIVLKDLEEVFQYKEREP